jgi:hypothetical protein
VAGGFGPRPFTYTENTMPELGSATIAAVNNQRHSLAAQEPIGASTSAMPLSLANGTIGGSFAAADSAPNFTLETPGIAAVKGADAVDSLYVQADVPVTAGAAAVTVVSGHITVATGGTYTSPQALAAGEYGWVYLTA